MILMEEKLPTLKLMKKDICSKGARDMRHHSNFEPR